MSRPIGSSDVIKSCCAALYESEWARWLLGDSFHPGGLRLTERLGTLLSLGASQRVLDVACGNGASALFLAERFGCAVTGVDYSEVLVAAASARARQTGMAGQVEVCQGDVDRLPFPDAAFDAVICECAFCTFSNKTVAAGELARVLRPGGKIGVADLTRTGPLPEGLGSLLAWIACLGDAHSVDEYAGWLGGAGFRQPRCEPHDEALHELVRSVRTKLLGVELLSKLDKLAFPAGTIEEAKLLARIAGAAVDDGRLGYVLMTAERSRASGRRMVGYSHA